MMSEEKIRDGLDELIRRAERERLWLRCHYDDLWFSPAELRKANAAGRFLWGAVNWELRDPAEKLSGLAKRVVSAQREAEDFERRIREWRTK